LIGEINGKVTAILNRLDEVVDRSNKQEVKLANLESRTQKLEAGRESNRAVLAFGLSVISILVSAAGVLIKVFF
jgi:hypothetical protein